MSIRTRSLHTLRSPRTVLAILALAPVAAWTVLQGEATDIERMPDGMLSADTHQGDGTSAALVSSRDMANTATTRDDGAAASELLAWQTLLAADLAKDPSRTWRRALQLAAQRPGWARALLQPLLEPLWSRREFELVLNGLNGPDGISLPEPLRQAWITTSVERWTDFAPAQAATWAATLARMQAPAASPTDGGTSGAPSTNAANAAPGSPDLLSMINDRWAHEDARGATVFASTLATGGGQALLTESLGRWLALDGDSARMWIRAQGPSERLDAAIAAHATQDELARNAPREAIDLVQRIADPARRHQAQWSLARTLRDIDASRLDLIQQAVQGAGAEPAMPGSGDSAWNESGPTP